MWSNNGEKKITRIYFTKHKEDLLAAKRRDQSFRAPSFFLSSDNILFYFIRLFYIAKCAMQHFFFGRCVCSLMY